MDKSDVRKREEKQAQTILEANSEREECGVKGERLQMKASDTKADWIHTGGSWNRRMEYY